jgi:KWG Leptospira.
MPLRKINRSEHYRIEQFIDPVTGKTAFSILNLRTHKKVRLPEYVSPIIPETVTFGEEPTDVGLTMVGIDDTPDNNAPHQLRPGVFNAKTGRLVKLPKDFEYMSWFSCGRASFCVCSKKTNQVGERKWGFLDESGRIAVKPIYAEPSNYTENLAPVVQDGRWSFIDKKGKVAIVLPEDCHRASGFSDGLARVVCGHSPLQPSGWPAKDNRLGFIDKRGKMVISPQFLGKVDNPGFYNGLAAVMLNDPRHLYGYIDKTGRWVIPAQFEYAEPFSVNGTANVRFGVCKFDKKQWEKGDRYKPFLAFLTQPGLLNLSRDEIHNCFGSPSNIEKTMRNTFSLQVPAVAQAPLSFILKTTKLSNTR